LAPRLLQPLDIDTFRWAQWPPGLDIGFSGVFTNLDAIAKLGQLHLDGGTHDAREVLSKAWISEASSTQTNNPDGETIDWQQGYGFQLWQSQHGYRGDGAFGQYMVVLPEHDAVIAMFSNTDHMQVVLDLMWEHLLPAFDRPGAAADTALAALLESLQLPTAAERLSAPPGLPTTDAVFGPAPPTPTSHRPITSVELRSGGILIHESDQSLDLPLTEQWITKGNIASSAAQHADGKLSVDVIFLNTPHRLELTLTNGEFQSDWGRLPLFGAGISNLLWEIADAPN